MAPSITRAAGDSGRSVRVMMPKASMRQGSSIGSTDTYIWNSSTGSTALGRFDVSSSQESLSGLSADGSTVIGYARTGTSGHRLFTPFAWTAGGGYTTLATPITENTFNHPSAVSGDVAMDSSLARSIFSSAMSRRSGVGWTIRPR